MAIVFLSHRTADKEIVTAVGEEIRRAGHEVWLDTWNINVGDSIVEKINSGLARGNILLLFCSEHDNLAPWISREWMSSLARKLNGQDLKIIPIILGNASLPVIISDISCIHIDSTVDKAAMNAIVSAISN